VTPAAAQRVLAQQAYRVLTRPRLTARVMRHNAVMDRRYHGATQTPLVGPRRRFAGGYCPACGSSMGGPRARQWTCRCSWNG
jgi:hypothetical protein